MAYSNYRGDRNRDRNERARTGGDRDREQQFAQRDDDGDSRRAREAMERDHYGAEGRGGYGRTQHSEGPMQRGYGQGDYDQDCGRAQGDRHSQGPGQGADQGYGYGQRGSFSGEGHESSGEGSRHYGNDSGGWEGREREQWRNRSAHGEYDRNANYGGYSQGQYGQSSHGRDPSGYSRDRDQHGQGSSGSGRPSGGAAYGNHGGGASNYGLSGGGYGGEYGSQGSMGRSTWEGSSQDIGQHRGRGPKGYQRSDDRIREEVCDCLTDDDRLDASAIEVIVTQGEVTLAGTVTSREDKRWAETLAERISGVKEVQNSIRVQEQQRSPQISQSNQSGQGAQGTQSAQGSQGAQSAQSGQGAQSGPSGSSQGTQSGTQASGTTSTVAKGKDKDNLQH